MSNDHDNQEGKIIEGHEYDGIKELDNPLPRWWLGTFYITIIFSIFYYGYYQLGSGPNLDQELESAMASFKKEQPPDAGGGQKDFTNEIQAALSNPDMMKTGKDAFTTTCLACHGSQGEGGIGPNLTDKFWIHSKGEAQKIYEAIVNGFPDKGMPAWGAVIPKENHVPLAAYVFSLKGTNPANGKAPQGDPVE